VSDTPPTPTPPTTPPTAPTPPPTPPASAVGSSAVVDAGPPDPLRTALLAALVAVAALVVGYRLGGVDARGGRDRALTVGCAVVFAVAGVAATRNAARGAGRRAEARAGPTAGTALRLACLIVGYLLVVLAALDLAGIALGHLLAGGALLAAVIGIAAQQVLGNLFAGLVLLFARPYAPGERIRVRAGAINGPHDGVVVSMDLLYTTLLTADGPMRIPNAVLLAAAVGPAPPEDAVAEDAAVEDDPAPGGAAGAVEVPGQTSASGAGEAARAAAAAGAVGAVGAVSGQSPQTRPAG